MAEQRVKQVEQDSPAGSSAPSGAPQPGPWRGIAGKLLVLTVVFIMVGEVLIFVPSIANFRLTWLENRIASAEVAALAVEAAAGRGVSDELRRDLLTGAGVEVVALKRDQTRHLMLSADTATMIDATYDLRQARWTGLIGDAFYVLAFGGDRVIGVVDTPPNMTGEFIEIALDETPLRREMIDFGIRILGLSVVLSLIVAALVLVALNGLLVRPIRRITANMLRFAEDPQDASRIMAPGRRADEIGVTERELGHLQRQLAGMLNQNSRLAALGLAVSKVSHDLRNMLSSAQLLSDRLASVEDPTVKRLAPKLIASLDRAIDFCDQTLKFGRVQEHPPERERFAVRPLVEEVIETAVVQVSSSIVLYNEAPPELDIDADREQLFRILMNLIRNAVEAVESAVSSGTLAGEGMVRIKAWREGSVTTIEVGDNGPGVPEPVREHLFEAFRGAGRSGGTGLGLAIAAELAHAHGGDIRLGADNGEGAAFQIVIPDHVSELRPGRRGRAGTARITAPRR